MPDLAEGSGPNGPAQTHANDEQAKPQQASAALTINDSILASHCQELTRLLALYDAKLRSFRGKEVRGAARDELESAARRVLGAADNCGEVMRHLIRSPASSVSGVFAKFEALCAALEKAGLDQDMFLSLGRSIQDDIARVSASERSHPIAGSHWLSGLQSRPDDDTEAASQGGRGGAH